MDDDERLPPQKPQPNPEPPRRDDDGTGRKSETPKPGRLR
jgi:hypothetical protein